MKVKSWRHEILSTAGILLAVFAVKSSLAATYVIPTGSMIPTIMPGDRIIADQRAYGLRVPFTDIHITPAQNPQRGDIVVFPSPIEDKTLIKRVVAVAGDTIEVQEGVVVLNGKKSDIKLIKNLDGGRTLYTEDLAGFQHPIILDSSRPSLRNMEPFQVPPGYFFAMGDNRDNSADSRYFGKVAVDEIKGRGLRILWSFETDAAPFFRFERFGHALSFCEACETK